jgi:hypothetical protein
MKRANIKLSGIKERVRKKMKMLASILMLVLIGFCRIFCIWCQEIYILQHFYTG